jgi:hypothetical protein
MHVPKLTVVIVVGARRDRVPGALASVLRQANVDEIEVRLIDIAPGDPPPVSQSDHRSVHVHRMPAGTLFSVAKATGVRHAAAPVIVFLEEHCRVWPGWASALIDAHRGPWAGVGAEVHNANPEVLLSRHIEVLNYSECLPPAARREVAVLPGHNSSFKRDVLLGYGDRLVELLRAEIVLHTQLRRDGHRLLLEPAARFSHINETSLESAARGRFIWNRCYGWMRARTFGWSMPRRVVYIVSTPLIPVYSLSRLALFAVRKRPALLPRLIVASPMLFAMQLAAACGHSAGLLFGIGDAEARFTLYEMNEFRRYREPVRIGE